MSAPPSLLQRHVVRSVGMDTFRPRPHRFLDLFGCEGGTGQGYADALWSVYVVDLFEKNTRARNPFPAYTGDAITALETLLNGGALPFTHRDGTVEWLALDDFDGIGASPPCQGYTRANTHHHRSNHARLIAVVRDLLVATGKPYVIENVVDARSEMVDPILLCGRMFGLTATDTDGVTLILERHRLFESNVPLTAPEHPEHDVPPGAFVAGVYGGSRRAPTRFHITNDDGTMSATLDKPPPWWPADGWTLTRIIPTASEDRYAARIVRGGGYVPRDKSVREALMGIRWMTGKGLEEAIPPVYTEHIGTQLLTHVMKVAA